MADQDPIAQAALTVMDAMLDAVVAIDPKGVVLAWNAAATRIFGWTREEVVGRSLDELIVPPQHRDAHHGGMRRYQETGQARVLNRRIEISAIDKSGREFPIELSIIATRAVPRPSSGFCVTSANGGAIRNAWCSARNPCA